MATRDSLKAYVDDCFSGKPYTTELDELHDKLIVKVCSTYDDCIDSGMSPDEAYNISLSSVGNIQEQIRVVVEGEQPVGFFEQMPASLEKKEEPKIDTKGIKSIKNAAIAVLWIITAIIAIGTDELFGDKSGDMSLIIVLIATILNVNINMAAKLVMLNKHSSSPAVKVKKLKAIKGGLTGTLWLIATIIFGATDMMMGTDSGVLAFPIAAVIQIIMNVLFKLKISGITGSDANN